MDTVMVITVVLADDHELAREGVRKLLADAPDIQILGLAVDGETAQQLVAQLRPQVLLLDLVMPGPSPADIALWVNIHHPETAVLVLTGHDRDYYLAQMLEAGAAGYLDKEVRGQQLIAAIRAAAEGQRVFTREQQQRVQAWQATVQARWESLTEREQEVLTLICQGQSNQQIAQSLRIRAKTVGNHVSSILDKLGVASRTEAALWAVREGFVARLDV